MSKTVREIFEDVLPKGIGKNLSSAREINAVYQFKITGDEGGVWVVDLTKDEEWVSSGPSESAQCNIEMSSEDWMDLMAGKLDGMQAFMMGKLRVSGDLGLATKLQQIFAMA